MKAQDVVLLPDELGGRRATLIWISNLARMCDVTVKLASGRIVVIQGVPVDLLTKTLPPEPVEIGHIHTSSRYPGHKYVLRDLGPHGSRSHWFRVTYREMGSSIAPLNGRWEDIA